MSGKLNGQFRVRVGLIVVAGLLASLVLPLWAAPPFAAPSILAQQVKPAARTAPREEKVLLHNPGMAGTYQYFALGRQQGMFNGEGIELQLLVMRSGLAVPALLSREVDYSAVAGSTIRSALTGVPLKLVMGTVTRVDFFLITHPKIGTARDLAGKVIAGGSVGDSGFLGVMEALKALGLANPAKQITWVFMPDTSRIAALEAGSASAIAVKANLAMEAKARGFKELAFTADYMEALSNGLVTHNAKLQERPDQVKRMIRATLRAMTLYRDQRDVSIPFIMKTFNMNRAVAEATYQAQIRTASFTGSISERALQAVVDQFRAEGTVRGPVSAQAVVDLSFLREVQAEMGLPVQPEIRIR